MRLLAPAKLNLCLYLGPERRDRLHELCSIFEPLELADSIEVSGAEVDEVICEGVDGDNLAATALAALRKRGWDEPPLRIEIEKVIPVAAGLGGGSADAAAVLRLAAGEIKGRERIAAALGADVPSQLEPRTWLVRGAGEDLEPLPDAASHGVVLIPLEPGLRAGDVYAQAERIGLKRHADELEEISGRVRHAAAGGTSPLEYADLLLNDLGPAAISLHAGIEPALNALRGAGAAVALVAGSGPTCAGLFEDAEGALDAADELRAEFPSVIATAPRRAGDLDG